MFRKFTLVMSLAAVSFFGYAQHQGWNLFDDVANSDGRSGSGSSRLCGAARLLLGGEFGLKSGDFGGCRL